MIYLIHFDEPYQHARHYLGFAENDLSARLNRHRAGAGARLMAVIEEAGIDWRVVRTWEGGRTLERRLKNRHNSAKLCPVCNPSAKSGGATGACGTTAQAVTTGKERA